MIEFNMNSPEESTKTPKKKKPIGTVVKIVIVLILLGALGGVGYMYYTTRQELNLLSSPGGQQELSRREVESIKVSLGKLTLLPDEDPLLATIIDAQYLATQSAFYQNAENGDKLVVFAQARKAYIYSPSRHIIVNSGPLITNSDAQVPEGQEEISIEIRNGTSVTGLGNQVRSQIEGPGIVVSSVGDAANRNYTQTQVIGLNSAITAANLAAIAQRLGGQVSTNVPANEAASNADILIIAGQAQAPAPSPVASPQP